MSVWQNIKDTNHPLEKRLFGFISLCGLLIGLFFLVSKFFSKVPDVSHLLADNSRYFESFLVALIVASILTISLYLRTLDLFEAETRATVRVSIMNVVIWTIFWLSWSIFCGWLTLTFKPQTFPVRLTIWALLIIPGFTHFILSSRLRQEKIEEEEDDKKRRRDDYPNAEPYNLCLDKKYFSGYYAPICVPAYLITCLVGYLL